LIASKFGIARGLLIGKLKKYRTRLDSNGRQAFLKAKVRIFSRFRCIRDSMPKHKAFET